MANDAVLELDESTVDPPEWEPATFTLECRNGHTWGSRGTYHARTRTPAPNFPVCPRRACGLPNVIATVYVGPNRPSVVEPSNG